jgi:thiamine biosynthesis lipoprotein
VLDFGGQVAAGGECNTVLIGVADPRDRYTEAAALSIDVGSAATSGLSKRNIIVDGVRHGHILDPRDGRPARDWGAVTVVAADPFAADCVSTALYVMGPDAGARWAATQPDIEALFVEESNGALRFKATEGLRSRLSLPPSHEVEWILDIEVRQNSPPEQISQTR